MPSGPASEINGTSASLVKSNSPIPKNKITAMMQKIMPVKGSSVLGNSLASLGVIVESASLPRCNSASARLYCSAATFFCRSLLDGKINTRCSNSILIFWNRPTHELGSSTSKPHAKRKPFRICRPQFKEGTTKTPRADHLRGCKSIGTGLKKPQFQSWGGHERPRRPSCKSL